MEIAASIFVFAISMLVAVYGAPVKTEEERFFFGIGPQTPAGAGAGGNGGAGWSGWTGFGGAGAAGPAGAGVVAPAGAAPAGAAPAGAAATGVASGTSFSVAPAPLLGSYNYPHLNANPNGIEGAFGGYNFGLNLGPNQNQPQPAVLSTIWNDVTSPIKSVYNWFESWWNPKPIFSVQLRK